MNYSNALGGTSSSEKLAGAIDDVQARTHSAIDSAADSVARGADKAADAAHDAVDDMAVNARFANYKASNAIDDAVDQGNNMVDVLGDKIRENPLVATGAALAIGYLIARLSR